jgi:hypothetical protein
VETLPWFHIGMLPGGVRVALTPVVNRLQSATPRDSLEVIDADGDALAKVSGTTVERQSPHIVGPTAEIEAASDFLMACHCCTCLPPG